MGTDYRSDSISQLGQPKGESIAMDSQAHEEPRRTFATMPEIRDSVAKSLDWNADSRPASDTLRLSHPTNNGVRGFLGEEHLARTAAMRGEIILDGPVGIEDWNARGPDLVTLAETKDGLVLKFYDNKARTNESRISAVDALDKNFAVNCERLRSEWAKTVADPIRPEAQQRLFATAIELLDARIYERVATNSGGVATGVTDRVASRDVSFQNTACNAVSRDFSLAGCVGQGPTLQLGADAATQPPPDQATHEVSQRAVVAERTSSRIDSLREALSKGPHKQPASPVDRASEASPRSLQQRSGIPHSSSQAQSSTGVPAAPIIRPASPAPTPPRQTSPSSFPGPGRR